MPTLKGCLCALTLALNVLVMTLAMTPFALLKLVVRTGGVRAFVDRALNALALRWVRTNRWWMALAGRTRWDVQGLEGLQRDRWYLICCNHQSWVDILVLQAVFLDRAPMLKFFLKRELIYVPVIGLAWWALDFPFMRRQGGRESLEQDLAAARAACGHFRAVPTAVLNFVEGTRFSEAKRTGQHAPYRHLLKPKAAGLAMVLDTMGDLVDAVLDVTIVYPQGAPRFWDLLTGRVEAVTVRVARVEPDAIGFEGLADPTERFKATRRWLNARWSTKDGEIEALLRAGTDRRAA